MPSIFRKLNLKEQAEILVVNAPASFEPELGALENVSIQRSIDASEHVTFSLAFVVRQADVDALSQQIATRAEGDAILWFAYPKGSSKKYKCEFNRDTGWAVLHELGFDPVRQVAIDEDWSALRFRRVEYIQARARQSKA